MKILLKPFYGKVFENNGVFDINNGDNIFFGFRDKLKTIGIEINTLDLKKEEGDWTVYCDVPYFWELKTWWHLLQNKRKAILFCFESPLVNPFSHISLFHKLFYKVYTWNDPLIDNIQVNKIYIPSLNFNLRQRVTPFTKKNFLVIINSNIAVPYPFWIFSPYKRELYPERLKAINFFENNCQDVFHLYGRGWNAPKKFSLLERIFGYKEYKSYRGSIARDAKSKVEILSQYKFCLCFENCRANGYISEKIIDCFKAHTVPIYYGAPNITNFIPKNCFIDFRDFNNYQELLNFLKTIDEKTYNQYIYNGIKYLQNNFDQYWSEEKFMKAFLEAISSEQ